MRIAYILPSLACTGPIIVARNLIRQLQSKAECIDLYYFNDRSEMNFECETFRIDPLTNIPYHTYDIIHAHMLQPDRYLWKHRNKIKGKTISTVHQFISYSLRTDRNILASKIFSPFWYKYLSVADHVVYISNSLMRDSAKHIRTKSASFIYNGIELSDANEMIPSDDLDRISRLKQNFKLIGNFANFTIRKGVDQLIDCLAINNDIALLLIGEGKVWNDLKKQAEKLGVDNRCIFLGFRPKTLPYYKLLDAYAMTSRSEAFGLSMVEATAMKIPLVCSDLTTFRELFDDSETGFFQNEHIGSLNEAIIDALKADPVKISNAFKKYKENYTAEKMSEAYWELYNELLSK